MAIKVRIIPKRDPRLPKGTPPKYYAVARRVALITEKELAEQIALMCTVKAPDVRGVLIALQEEVIKGLLAGYSVQLGELGIMRNVIKTSPAATADDFTVDNIKSLRTQFIQRNDIRLRLDDPDVQIEEAEYLPYPT